MIQIMTGAFQVFFITFSMIALILLNKNHFPTYVKHCSISFFLVIVFYTISFELEMYFETFPRFNYGRVIFSMLGYMLLPTAAFLPILSLCHFKKRSCILLSIPCIINFCIYFLMLFTKWVVYFTEDNIFNRGPLGFTVFFVEGFYAIFYIYVVIRIFMEKRIRDGIIVSIIVIFIYASGVIDVIYSKGFIVVTLAIGYTIYYLHLCMLHNRKYEILLAESQKNELMLSQIQPHFMYNILSSIYYLCDYDPKKAKEAVSSFSTYLRANLDTIRGENIVPFNNELSYCKNYLNLEKIRFDNELNVEYDIDTTDFKLPKFTLQPLVENAVKYGVTQKEGGGTIEIYVHENDKTIIIGVKDDGVGFNPDEKKNDGRSHTGIENINNRILEYFDTNLIIESEIGKGSNIYFVIKKEIDK